jgi:hypothetical protein
MLRDNAYNSYKRVYDQLVDQGVLSKEKLEDEEEKNITSPFNCQLIEKMGYSVGKTFVWVPM